MNEITVYQSPEEMAYDKEKFRRRDYFGYVYVIEFGDHVKIGSSEKPLNRIYSLASMARNYCFTGIGRIAVSPAHSNYYANEHFLHDMFSKNRIADGELFDITLESAIEAMSNIELRVDTQKQNPEEKFKRLLCESFNPHSTNVFRASAQFELREYINDFIKEYSKKCQEYYRLKEYAPKGTETFFSLIQEYSDKTRHVILETMKRLPLKKQKRILAKIYMEKTLPYFLKTIAEGN